MGMQKKASSLVLAGCILGMLISGTVNTLTTKIQFTMKSVNIDGEVATFQKPWFGSMNMLGAMMIVGIVDALVAKARPGDVVVVESAGGRPYWQKVCLVAVPAAFDLVATALCCIGILYIPASVWQMLRGASIIFAAILSVLFLDRKMFAFNLIGLALCVAGVTLVGLANIWGGSAGGDGGSGGSAADLAFGTLLVLAGQVVQAAQVIAEEWLMKGVDLPALRIVGLEGFWGIVQMWVIIYPALWLMPGADHGHQEDVVDTMVMLSNSMPLLGMVCLYLLSCGLFNATGIAITQHLSAVHRMMLDASRTTVIWAFGLAVHARDPTSPFGEQWTPYSVYQLLGFVVLVVGQATYGEVLRIPGLYYPTVVAADPYDYITPASATHLTTPLPHRLQEVDGDSYDAL